MEAFLHKEGITPFSLRRPLLFPPQDEKRSSTLAVSRVFTELIGSTSCSAAFSQRIYTRGYMVLDGCGHAADSKYHACAHIQGGDGVGEHTAQQDLQVKLQRLQHEINQVCGSHMLMSSILCRGWSTTVTAATTTACDLACEGVLQSTKQYHHWARRQVLRDPHASQNADSTARDGTG